MPIARIGQDFVVNTTTPNEQYNPAITTLADGRFVVTWQSQDTSGSDTSGGRIRARLYNADGSAAGSDFVVNSTAANSQYDPAVTALTDGRFLVTWESSDASGSDASPDCIRARLYNADGSAAGEDFVVNSTTVNTQNDSSVTALPGGGFVVTWDSWDHSGSDTSGYGIRARLYDAAGLPAGDDFVVNTTTTFDQAGPSVTALAGGRFLVTWTSFDGNGSDTSPTCIRGRLYNADGSTAGGDFIVNSTTAEGQVAPSAAALPDSRFLVTWHSYDTSGSDTSESCIRGRFYNADGSAAGSDFVVNSTTADDQFLPSVTALADGRLVVAWQSHDAGADDTSQSCIRARLFNVDGSPAGADFVVNTTTPGYQVRPAVTALPDGRFVTAWVSYDASGSDTSGTAIRAQVFDPTLFNGTADADSWKGGNLPDRIHGDGGTDLLYGLDGDDLIDGGDGADVIEAGAGDDVVDGGPGDDLAVFSGSFGSYAIQHVEGRIVVAGPDGTDTLTSIEQLDFADTALRVLAAIAEDSGARVITQAELLSGLEEPPAVARNLALVSGNGTLTDNHDGSWTYRPAANDDTDVSFSYQIDGRTLQTAHATLDITPVPDAPPVEPGTPGDDTVAAPLGTRAFDGGLGIDTITFDFRLVDATVSHDGNKVIIDGPGSRTTLTGFERFVFTDGTVDNADGNALVDDLFYYAGNHDVWNAGADADAHYAIFGWHEGRDPDAFFSTAFYLAGNPDVRAAGVNPLDHWHAAGWREGRAPSAQFDPQQYLAANPDVAAAHVDPLLHYLQSGYQEGRVPSSLLAPNGFDYAYYLAHNGDVAAAGVDPYQHFMTTGWREGRDPNELFDTGGYLAAYADVQAAGVNPLEHYHQSGWREGRDPSPGFDTTDYLAAYADVQAAQVDPLVHFLQFGSHEGRSALADGVWG